MTSRFRRQLVVLARWPAAGRCKRRLAASCGSAAAAAGVQRRLTAHTLQTAHTAALAEQAGLVLAADGLGPRALRRWSRQLLTAKAELQLRAQGGGSLGCRMQRQLRLGFAAGLEQVVLIGTDLPSLEALDLQAAFRALEQRPLVLGPAGDGGYWLLGLNRQGFAHAGTQLMSAMAWGTDQVLAQTLARAQALELDCTLLREQNDLDTRADLEPWLLLQARR